MLDHFELQYIPCLKNNKSSGKKRKNQSWKQIAFRMFYFWCSIYYISNVLSFFLFLYFVYVFSTQLSSSSIEKHCLYIYKCRYKSLYSRVLPVMNFEPNDLWWYLEVFVSKIWPNVANGNIFLIWIIFWRSFPILSLLFPLVVSTWRFISP